jgi:hypothetical protein
MIHQMEQAQRALLPPQLIEASPIVTVRGVNRRYGDVIALRHVDVTVYPVRCWGLSVKAARASRHCCA